MAGNKPGPDKGDPRMVEAGRKGGNSVKQERGREFFQAIGRKGGKKTAEKYGAEFFSQIGRKGGSSVKADKDRNYEGGSEAYYSDIGTDRKSTRLNSSH